MSNTKIRKIYSYDLYINGVLDTYANPLFKTQKQCFDYILSDVLSHKIPRRYAYRNVTRNSPDTDSNIKTADVEESIEASINILPNKIYLYVKQNIVRNEYEFKIKTVN